MSAEYEHVQYIQGLLFDTNAGGWVIEKSEQSCRSSMPADAESGRTAPHPNI